MGAKYTTVAITGYNSSPPPDDASQGASNLITWAKHKDKLGDPIKTGVEAINTALVAAFNYEVRQITNNDSTVAGDHMKVVEIGPNVSTAVTVTLGDAATMTSVYRVFITNSSTIAQTIARTTASDTINGVASNLTIPSKSTFLLQTTNGADGYLVLGAYPFDAVNGTEETAPADSDLLPIYDLSTGKPKFVAVYRFLPDATTDVEGKVELATQAEYSAGTASRVPTTDLNGITLGTEVASTSSTTVTFAGFPAGTRRINISFVGISTNSTSALTLQIGDAGGLENSGYSGGVGQRGAETANNTSFLLIQAMVAANTFSGQVTLCLEDASDFTWTLQGVICNNTSGLPHSSAGSKALSAELTQLQISTASGDTFDAGAINVSYER